MLKRIIIGFFLCFAFVGCAKDPSVVTVNNYRQTNYTTLHCFDGSKTFSQIIICQKEVDKKEKMQNNVTNSMLDDVRS